jgi:hypothetical protein
VAHTKTLLLLLPYLAQGALNVGPEPCSASSIWSWGECRGQPLRCPLLTQEVTHPHISHVIPQPAPNNCTPWLTAHQPGTNYDYVGVNHDPNYTVYGQHRYDLYHDNLWYGSEGPPPSAVCFCSYVYQRVLTLLTSPSLKNLERQHAYQTNPNVNIGYPNPGNVQHMPVPPGPSHIEHNIPLAHVRFFLSFLNISCLWPI